MTNLSVKDFNFNEHYEIAQKWWQDHGWTPIPMTLLPPTGKIIYANDKPVCCGFLYKTDCSLVSLDHVVADKESDNELRAEALDQLIKSLISETSPDQVIIAWLMNENLIDKYKQNNFILGDKGLTTVIRRGGL